MTTATALRPRLVIALCLALAACASPPAPPHYADLRFTDRPPIRLDVAAVDVRSAYQMPMRSPNVEHDFPVAPGRAAENWAHDRLKPAGRAGRAVFTVGIASVVETSLPTDQSFKGAFTTEPSERYDLTLAATLQIIDGNGLTVRNVAVTTTRSQSLLENITPNERDRAWYDMTKAALADFDRQMEGDIRSSFGMYVVP